MTVLPRRLTAQTARRRLSAVFAFAVLAGLSVAFGPASAADEPSSPSRAGAALLEAVVGIDADIPPTARTADTLGTRRQGSGAVISDDGLIVTIGYLIMEASAIDVVLGSGRKVPAEIVGYDHESGLGLLRALMPLEVEPIALGTAAELGVDHQALIANRLGIEGAQGVLVVDRRLFAGAWEYLLEDAIFTTPPNPNFSGAALLGADGKLLGIGYLFVGHAAFAGAPLPGNMFVPVDELTAILDEMLANGRRSDPPRPWLGIYTTELRGHVFVERIAGDGPAARSGLEPGDVILSVGATEVSDVAGYLRALWDGRTAGDPVELKVVSPSAGARTVTIRSMDRRDWLRLDPTF